MKVAFADEGADAGVVFAEPDQALLFLCSPGTGQGEEEDGFGEIGLVLEVNTFVFIGGKTEI